MPDVEGQGGNGVMPFPRVSNAAATADNADLDPAIAGNFVYILLPDSINKLHHQNEIHFLITIHPSELCMIDNVK